MHPWPCRRSRTATLWNWRMAMTANRRHLQNEKCIKSTNHSAGSGPKQTPHRRRRHPIAIRRSRNTTKCRPNGWRSPQRKWKWTKSAFRWRKSAINWPNWNEKRTRSSSSCSPNGKHSARSIKNGKRKAPIWWRRLTPNTRHWSGREVVYGQTCTDYIVSDWVRWLCLSMLFCPKKILCSPFAIDHDRGGKERADKKEWTERRRVSLEEHVQTLQDLAAPDIETSTVSSVSTTATSSPPPRRAAAVSGDVDEERLKLHRLQKEAKVRLYTMHWVYTSIWSEISFPFFWANIWSWGHL